VGQQAKSDEKVPDAGETILYEDGSVYIVITGQTTLTQAEKATGIPAKTIASELRLPSNVSSDDTLGRLRKKFGFSLLEVRDVISDLLSRETAPQKKEKASQEKADIHEAEHEQKLTRGISAEDQSGILITGRMTFYDIAKKTGIPARQIAAKLNLPSNVSLDESMGRLRRRYGFTIQDVRDAIASLVEKNKG
jgi:DNA-binding transcriptional MerR regulator